MRKIIYTFFLLVLFGCELEQPVNLSELDTTFDTGYVTPSMYGGVPNDDQTDDAAFQQMMEVVKESGKNILIPAGRWDLDSVWRVGPGLRGDRIHITAYNATIRSTAPIVLDVSRSPKEFQAIVEGLTVRGDRIVGQIGIKMAILTQSAIRDCEITNCWEGIRYAGWNSIIENNVVKGGFIGINAEPLSNSGCQGGSNINTFLNNRVFGDTWTYELYGIVPRAAYWVGGSGNVFRECTAEGRMYQYDFAAPLDGNCEAGIYVERMHWESKRWKASYKGVEFTMNESNHRTLYWGYRHKVEWHSRLKYGVSVILKDFATGEVLKTPPSSVGQLHIYSGMGWSAIARDIELARNQVPKLEGIHRGVTWIAPPTHKGLVGVHKENNIPFSIDQYLQFTSPLLNRIAKVANEVNEGSGKAMRISVIEGGNKWLGQSNKPGLSQ